MHIVFQENDRFKRSTNERTTRDTNTTSYKYLEAALIVPKSYEEKYGSDHFQTILLVTANMVRIRMRVWTLADDNTPVGSVTLQSFWLGFADNFLINALNCFKVVFPFGVCCCNWRGCFYDGNICCW